MKGEYRKLDYLEDEMIKGYVIIVEVKWIPEVKERTTIKGMTKEVIIDIRSRYANTLLTTFITASATPIARSSPYHEILLCRWLVGGDSYCYRCDGK